MTSATLEGAQVQVEVVGLLESDQGYAWNQIKDMPCVSQPASGGGNQQAIEQALNLIARIPV